MARRRGFFAELQYQAQQAQKRKAREQAQAYRQQQAAHREYERRLREYERAVAKMERASAAERKRLEAEAKRAHIEARMAEVEEMNAALANTYNEIANILAATLDVDDYVDLEGLRRTVSHPPFRHVDLEWPTPPPPLLVAPPEPVWAEPPPAGGLFGKKKHAERVAQARAAFEAEHAAWQQTVVRLQQEYQAQKAAHAEAERQRLVRLDEARRAYAEECAAREREATEANARLDELIAGLAYGVEDAVQEYVTIVLANSVYPETFPVGYDHSFDASTRELALTVSVPAPSELPSVKAYKYSRTTDEITGTPLSAKEQRDRYANAVNQVALRTLHEVFEADRAGHIRSVSATIGTTALNPATGRKEYIALAMVAADRETFLTFDLGNVVPAATLKHLGAVLSKNPFDLVPIDTGQGVRSSRR